MQRDAAGEAVQTKLGVTEKPDEKTPSASHGASEGPRSYDYGPGSDFGTPRVANLRAAG
jgi:hypothetical protein